MMKAEKKEVRDSPNIQQSLPAHKRPIPPKNGQIHSARPQAGEGNMNVLAQRGRTVFPGQPTQYQAEKYPLLRSSGRA